ncbi:MAG: hypothetical protein ACT4NX_06395 [Deltaproteobacteria bacterium]
MNRPIKGAYSAFLVLILGIIGLSCGGANPPFAPDGSTITIVNPPGDVTIPTEAITSIRVQALVRDPDGDPLNDVRVVWRISFAGPLDLVIDTDGDGDGDAPALQLIDPDACGDVPCDNFTIPQIFAINPFAFVESPFLAITDNRGVSDVIILINGESVVLPASIEASAENGAVATLNFNVNDR